MAGFLHAMRRPLISILDRGCDSDYSTIHTQSSVARLGFRKENWPNPKGWYITEVRNPCCRESETSDMQEDSQLQYSFGAFTDLSEMSSKSPNNTKGLWERESLRNKS
ncbi:hypothetical protein MUK42_27160 [Musa troglodytarum]|uniref:Uncharacterized protein n=1 Tax=Musa troglodytarum TaxID=320322 RepID=A0A9E7JT07_9LILI|nr:hypothetical protein MUK42_27160 [Musa troglodytarum]